MKLFSFPLMTDENIHPRVLAYLEEAGCDVLDVKRSKLIGSSDRQLLDLASSEGRVIVTHDSDFGTLAFTTGKLTSGIIYLRPGHIDPEFTIGTLRSLADQTPDLDLPFLVVAHRSEDVVRIRVRRIPTL